MNKTLFPSLLGLVALAATAAPAFAASSPVSLVSEPIKIDKIVTENGQSKHVISVPQKVFPGDHLVFATDYHNEGNKPVDHFVVTNPLPKDVALSDDGFGNFEVSVDGGKSWGALATLRVADGKGGTRAAQASDVTHVRWVIPEIAPGASGTLEYHGIVR